MVERVQAWRSDELKDDWELERTVDEGSGGSRTIQLRGAGGIVNSVVASVLGDLMTAPPPCSVADCCELNDDAALEVRKPLHSAVDARARVASSQVMLCCRHAAKSARPSNCCSCCSPTCTRKLTLPVFDAMLPLERHHPCSPSSGASALRHGACCASDRCPSRAARLFLRCSLSL